MISRIEQLRAWVVSLERWPRRFAALLMGVVTALALPPLYILPLLIPGFVGFAWLIEGSVPSGRLRHAKLTKKAARSAFAVGWWFGVGFFAAGLYWVSFSFFVDAATFAWMAPFALFFLSAGMALYIGLVGWAAYVSSRDGANLVLNLGLWWVVFEWIRGWAFTGFPWNLIGNVWTISEAMIQITAVTGVFGLSLVTVLAAAAPAVLGNNSIVLSKRYLMVVVTGAILVMIWVGGHIRLNQAVEVIIDGVNLRLVQPNIEQRDKWKPHLRQAHFDKLLRLSRPGKTAATDVTTHIIWPETATPLFLSAVPEALELVSVAAPIGGALITGAPRQRRNQNGFREIWNSVHVIDLNAYIRDTYDKQHLVPFGEYIPFRSFISFPKLTGAGTDFSPGVGPKILNAPGVPSFIPLICYEAIFPGQIQVDQEKNRPGWLLNLTNDAWFGSSSGPYQHFASAQLRSVELGLPLVRVANTGISGVIDSYGRVRVRTALNEEISVESLLPARLSNSTWFAEHGNTTILCIILILFGVFRLRYFGTKG